jgi:hypothetical protein
MSERERGKKLTLFIIGVIILIIIGIVGIGQVSPDGGDTKTSDQQPDLYDLVGSSGEGEPSSLTKISSNTPSPKKNQQPATTPETVNFSLEEPQPDGKLKAVIELGAEGFNYFIIKVDSDKNWALKKSSYGYSNIYENLTEPHEIARGISRYITEIMNYGVQSNNIHFVVSSGAQLKTITDETVKVIRRRGFTAHKVTPGEEGKFSFWAAVPKKWRKESFVVDIGSGNTKIAWQHQQTFEPPITSYGAKYYMDEQPPSDDVVYKSIATLVKKIRPNSQKHCFIIGGGPYKLAKKIRKDKEVFTRLLTPDAYQRQSDRYELEGKKMRSGLNIYRAIQENTEIESCVFNWRANFTIGYLLKLPY